MSKLIKLNFQVWWKQNLCQQQWKVGLLLLWHLLVSLLSGIIIGVLLSYAIMVYGRRRLRNIKGEPKRESHII